MLLNAGDRLGPYEIIAPIGAGGMGEVYRAHDSRIGRDVAVKVSSAEFGERSEREARAVAALNHPNICTLHDVGPNYLVMELVEGEAPKGPLPLATVLHYARQIADALDAAHEKGIVHRDLKPGNIKIRSDGTVKVLDFGLAKIASPDSGEGSQPNLSHSPTIGATQPGMILGTAAYMAPEQARGRPVDKRADIWAFGVVVYEMLTGRRAFEGDDVSSILASVIRSEPRWDGVPPNIRRLLESCLEKDPRKRLRDIGDVWKLLDEGPAAGSRPRGGRAAWIAAGLMTVATAVALWALWGPSRGAARSALEPQLRLDVGMGPDMALVPLAVPTFSSVVISPDGTRLVFVGSQGGGSTKLFTRRLDQAKATELAGTDGAGNPIFSSDGRWVGFWDGRRIAKVSVDGGAVVPLGDVRVMTGGHWDSDGALLIGTGVPSADGVLRIPAAGGALTSVATLAPGEMFHMKPQALPGGKALLVSAVAAPPSQDNTTVDVISIADRRRKTIVRGAASARYLPSGHLVYVTKSTLFAVPFDVDRLETRGAAVPILDDVAYDAVANIAQFDVSNTGTLVYRRSSGSAFDNSTLQWLDSSGKSEPLLAKPAAYRGPPRVSPDGTRIAITIRDGGNQDIWVYEPQRELMTRLTFGGGMFGNPVWSPDGQYVVFASFANGLFWNRADGAGQPQLFSASKSLQMPTAFTPDGKRLAYFQPDSLPQIWTVAVENGDRGPAGTKPVRFMTNNVTDFDAAFSPDGKWIAYSSNESGRFEVYVRAFDSSATAGGGKWLISNSGGGAPIWSQNRRDLLYQAGDRLMVVGYKANGNAFVADKPRAWSPTPRVLAGFDLSPNGSRVAAIVPVGSPSGPAQEQSVVLVTNFFDELRRRAPVGK